MILTIAAVAIEIAIETATKTVIETTTNVKGVIIADVADADVAGEDAAVGFSFKQFRKTVIG